MEKYESPTAEIIDFTAEIIMDGQIGEGFSMEEGDEAI